MTQKSEKRTGIFCLFYFIFLTKSVMLESVMRSDKSQISSIGHLDTWITLNFQHNLIKITGFSQSHVIFLLLLFFIFTATVIVSGIYNHSVWQFMHTHVAGVKQWKISEM